jgi:hypothetical protein
MASDFRLLSRDRLFEVLMAEMCIGQGNLLEEKLALVSCCVGAENTSRRRDSKEIYVPALCKLSIVHCLLGNIESAGDVAQRAVGIDERNHPGHSEEVFWARFNLGNRQIKLSKFGLAEANFRKCIDSRERHSELHILAMQRSRRVYHQWRRNKFSYILLSYVHEVAKQSIGGDSESSVSVAFSLGSCLCGNPTPESVLSTH